jgi:hypothetical protein
VLSFRKDLKVTLGGLLLICCFSAAASPSIEITNVPVFGSFDNVRGRVLDATPSQHRVAVFIYVPGAGWWSKPFCDPQLTIVQPNTSWTADITTGGSDQFATRITALLVATNYAAPCVEGLPALPANVTTQAVASATVERVNPNLRSINFSGYEWWVKASPGLVGPGPNYFSDSTSNVWVDAQGELHLRITNRSNQWQCAEIITRRTFGYGSYRFELGSSVNNLNPNAVLGLFTWSDDPAYAHREIDVECSRWGNAADINNSQFVVQPWDLPGHLVRYAVPPGQANTTHLFTWASNRVSFQSQKGSYVPDPSPDKLIASWIYALPVPQTGDENIRINLWLYESTAPVGGAEVEFVIKSFQYVPLGPAQPALLTNTTQATNGQFRFTIVSEPDRRYEVQTSTNLQHWTNLQTVLATNTLLELVFTNSPAWEARFFRTVTLP